MTFYDFITPLRKWWWLLVISTVVAGAVSYYISAHVRDGTMEALGLEWLPQYRVIALPNTQLIEITVIDSIPGRAHAVAQEISNQLIMRSPTGTNSEEKERQEFISEQLDTLQIQIEDTQEEISANLTLLGELDSARDILSTENEISALQTKLSTLQTNYANLLSTTQQGAVNVLSVIEEAEVPNRPVDKNSILTAGMTAAVGLALAALGAYLLEFLDKSVKTIEEVSELVQAPILGYIPKIPRKEPAWDYVSQKPRSPISDSFRSLRTNLEFTQANKNVITILVSSPTIAEGKSTIASNLARIISQTEKNVVLIDADLRKSVIQQTLDIPDHKGLSNLLSNQTDLNEILLPLNGDKFFLIPSGPYPPNPAELLASEKFDEIIDKLKEKADVLIIDAPPFVVTDAAILAAKADGILVVVQPGQTDKNAIKAMMEQLEIIDTPILGIVANRYQKNTGYYSNYYSIQSDASD